MTVLHRTEPVAALPPGLAFRERALSREIKPGLARLKRIHNKISPTLPAPLISVAGTNGKGSVCRGLEALALAHGLRVAVYLSPHLLRLNERFRLNGVDVDDARLAQAAARVAAAAGASELTVFEFDTMVAAVLCAMESARAGLDLVVFEVGLGGRLDAVNAWDADVAVITAIALDHQQWLGEDRAAIGREKAGIMRPGTPCVCGDPQLPQSIADHARALGAPLHRLGHEFDMAQRGAGFRDTLGDVALPQCCISGDGQQRNVATALAAWRQLPSRLTAAASAAALTDGLDALCRQRLPGRQQHGVEPVDHWLDVAHNPHAAQALAARLAATPVAGRTLAVFGALADKDLAGMIAAMAPVVDGWYLGALAAPRGLGKAALRRRFQATPAVAGLRAAQGCDSIAEAWAQALLDHRPGDRIVVFGSFHTVAEVMRLQSSGGC